MAPRHLNFCVEDADGKEIFFKANFTTLFRRVLSSLNALDPDHPSGGAGAGATSVGIARLYFQHAVLEAEDTPASVGLSDDDHVKLRRLPKVWCPSWIWPSAVTLQCAIA